MRCMIKIYEREMYHIKKLPNLTEENTEEETKMR